MDLGLIGMRKYCLRQQKSII